MPDFPIIEVPRDAPEATEQIGTKSKFWYEDRELGPCVFKEGRPGTGENWAEKVAAELASLLGVPHARYELAICDGRQGVVTPTFVPAQSRLVHGNEILSAGDRNYDPELGYGQSLHTVRQVVTVMRAAPHLPPNDWNVAAPLDSALAVFEGYIMFDAWIGNTDRHHQNWGFISAAGGDIRLAPTFDHASSLGRELSDDRRGLLLSRRDRRQTVLSYARRGRSAFYKSQSAPKPLTLHDAFGEFSQACPDGALAWVDRLAEVQKSAVENILAGVPRSFMPPLAGDFAMRLLDVNGEKLLSRDWVRV